MAAQKKAEELVGYSIKINRELLKTKNIFAHSYRESFTLLDIFSIEKEFLEKMGEIALFRNRLAHEYLIITKKEIEEELSEITKYYPRYIKEIFSLIK